MTFDPDAFINQTTEGPMSVQITQAPEGEWQAVVSTDGELKDWFGTAEWEDRKTGEHKSAPTCEIPIEITDQRAKDLIKRDKITTRYRMFLDLTPDGKLDASEGKNVKLGALRAAVGQNGPQPWNFGMLRGAGPFLARVKQNSDKKNPEIKYAEVTRVTKLT